MLRPKLANRNARSFLPAIQRKLKVKDVGEQLTTRSKD